jgi:Nucleotidyl transferase AbiEii toxin, Type IV TA system
MIPATRWSKSCRTISTKYRRQQERGDMPVDFMRHYYDVYSLLRQPSVQAFVGTATYHQHKDDHFPQADNKNIRENAAFQLSDKKTRELYERAYEAGSALYYQGKPSFTEILAALDQWKDRL